MEQERRQGPDLWIKWLPHLNLFTWGLFFVALVVVHYAQPEMDTGLVRYHELNIRQNWLQHLVYWIQIVLSGTIALIVGNLIIVQKRARRKQDVRFLNQKLLFILSSFVLLLITITTL